MSSQIETPESSLIAHGAARRVVAITGAGGVLGRALARRLGGEPNTALVLSDVAEESLAASVEAVKGTQSPTASALADVSNFDQVQSVVQLAFEQFGRLDVLISNAGILSPNGRIHNLSTEDWERAFQVNVLGGVNCNSGRGARDAHTALGLHHSHGVRRGSHGMVTLGSLLRHQSGSDSARQGRRRRIRPRRDPSQLRLSGYVPIGDPCRTSRRSTRHDCCASPARARLGGGSRGCLFLSRQRRVAMDDRGSVGRRRRVFSSVICVQSAWPNYLRDAVHEDF